MKWLGAILIISATTIIGYFSSKKLTDRPKQIRILINTIQMIEAEMMYSKLPLSQLFTRISQKTLPPFRSFFLNLARELKGDVLDFYSLWEREVTRLLNNSSLKKAETDILNDFGKNLGQYNLNEQQKQIKLTLTHLERELNDAIDERDTYERITKSIGFLIGLFIVIIFF